MGKIGLIVAREWNERVRKKSFVITTLLTPILMVGFIAFSAWMASHGSTNVKRIAVVDQSGVVAERLEDHPTIDYQYDTETDIDELKRNKPDNTWGVLLIGQNILNDASDIYLYSFAPSTIDIESTISRDVEQIVEAEKLKAYQIDNLPQIMAEVKTNIYLRAFTIDESGEESDTSSALAYAMAYIFGFLMYIFVLIYGSQVMNGVIEEKSSKVLEVMVSSVRPFELMMGKILGIAAVAITQFSLWVVIALSLGTLVINNMLPDEMLQAAQGLSTDGSMEVLGSDMAITRALGLMMNMGYIVKLLIGFLVLFVGGYLLYAAMFAAVGSAVDDTNSTNQFQSIITMPIIVALVVMFAAMNDPDGGLAVWFSIIPFTSPIVMAARLPYGVPVWELALSIALLYGTFAVMVGLAGKIYRVGILMHGKKVTFGELYKWMKYKY